MRVEFAVYAVLLAGSLGAAWWASAPAVEGEEEKIALVSVEPKAVTEMSFTTKDTEVKAARRGDDQRFWVDYQKTESVAAATATATGTGTGTGTSTATQVSFAPPTPKVTTERFLGNEKMDELLASFNPLKALRVIGKVTPEQLKEFGLDDPEGKVTIRAGSQTVTLAIGKKSYGSRNRFVLEGDRVVLVDDQGLENLERANLRLYDRRLVSFEMDEAQKAEIAASGKTKRMAHTQRDKQGELVWSDDEENGQAKPSYGAWMDKIAKLRLASYADEAQEATLAKTPPFLEIVLEKDGKALDKLSFKKLPAVEAGKTDYFVTSSFLRTHGKLPANRVEPVEKDLEQVL